MESRHGYAIDGMISAFFGSRSDVLDCDWRRNFLKNGYGFSSLKFEVTSRFPCKAMCTITTKEHNCWLLVHKRNIQHVRGGFALFTVVETGSFVG